MTRLICLRSMALNILCKSGRSMLRPEAIVPMDCQPPIPAFRSIFPAYHAGLRYWHFRLAGHRPLTVCNRPLHDTPGKCRTGGVLYSISFIIAIYHTIQTVSGSFEPSSSLCFISFFFGKIFFVFVLPYCWGNRGPVRAFTSSGVSFPSNYTVRSYDSLFFCFCHRQLSSIHENSQTEGVGSEVQQRASKDASETISIWRWLLFILFFYFSVVLVLL